jgi:CDGSH-type Zn-finger protein/uncharacterized Fe-S cluster protein YjdI
MKSKIHNYTGEELTVTFDSARCIHAGRCVQGLPGVFDVNAKPWVQPDKASADEVRAIVAQCPSGALAVQPATEPASENVIEIRPNGPVYVHGKTCLKTLGGETLLEDDRMALCRCGASQNKPLCDNTHREAKFRAAATLGKLAADGGECPDGELTISTAPNGPLLLDGPAEIRGAGDAVRVRKAALCRCGLSENKPYCDGSHSTGGFQAD